MPPPPVDPTAGYLFLSYSRADQDYVRRLAADLRDHGFAVWFDDQIDLGERWWPTIVQAIRDCAVMLIVMSPEAEASIWIEREILLAQQNDKTTLPLLLRGKGMSLLITQQHVDVRHGEMPPATFYAQLRRTVARAAAAESQPSTPNQVAPSTPILPAEQDRTPMLSTDQRRQLVQALLGCALVADRQSRSSIVEELPPGIRFNARRSDRDREDVRNLVMAALDYPDGLARLIEAVRFFEGDSLGMRAVDQLLAEWDVWVMPGEPPPVAAVAATPPPSLRQVPVVVAASPAAPAWYPPTAPIAFDWIEIPAGPFRMGADLTTDAMANDSEKPPHLADLPVFWTARVPVTVAQFAAFVQATGHKTTAEIVGVSYTWNGSAWKLEKGAHWRAPRGPRSSVANKQNHPVTILDFGF